MYVAAVVEKTAITPTSVLHQLSLHQLGAIICTSAMESYCGLESYCSQIAM